MKKRIAVGLIIYHPPKNLISRIEIAVSLGLNLFIFDNSPFESELVLDSRLSENITYLTAGKNVGLGYSLATLCATAYAHGYQSLLFLDQDTGISPQTLVFIENFSQSIPPETHKEYAAIVFSGQAARKNNFEDVPLAISSGSLFNLPVMKQIGWHNEKYFVDCVDYEFCLRARRCGFKIGLIRNTPDFDHVTEQPDQTIYLFRKQLLVRRYSFNRINDAIRSYLRLIFVDLLKNKPSDTYLLLRSMGIYICGQILSRLVRTK